MGLSFCIRTAGVRDNYLRRCMGSIHTQGITAPYEVLVCGTTNVPYNDEDDFRWIVALEDAKNARYGKMLNVLAENAKYDILVFLDDDSELLPNWWNVAKELDVKDFDLTTFRLLQFQHGITVCWYDWATVASDRGAEWKPWDEPADDKTYIGTGALIVQKNIALAVKFNEQCGKGEDVLFSRACFQKGYRLKTYPFMEHAVALHYMCPEGRNEFKP